MNVINHYRDLSLSLASIIIEKRYRLTKEFILTNITFRDWKMKIQRLNNVHTSISETIGIQIPFEFVHNGEIPTNFRTSK